MTLTPEVVTRYTSVLTNFYIMTIFHMILSMYISYESYNISSYFIYKINFNKIEIVTDQLYKFYAFFFYFFRKFYQISTSVNRFVKRLIAIFFNFIIFSHLSIWYAPYIRKNMGCSTRCTRCTFFIPIFFIKLFLTFKIRCRKKLA